MRFLFLSSSFRSRHVCCIHINIQFSSSCLNLFRQRFWTNRKFLHLSCYSFRSIPIPIPIRILSYFLLVFFLCINFLLLATIWSYFSNTTVLFLCGCLLERERERENCVWGRHDKFICRPLGATYLADSPQFVLNCIAIGSNTKSFWTFRRTIAMLWFTRS